MYSCKYCDNEYSSQGGLTRHLKTCIERIHLKNMALAKASISNKKTRKLEEELSELKNEMHEIKRQKTQPSTVQNIYYTTNTTVNNINSNNRTINNNNILQLNANIGEIKNFGYKLRKNLIDYIHNNPTQWNDISKVKHSLADFYSNLQYQKNPCGKYKDIAKIFYTGEFDTENDIDEKLQDTQDNIYNEITDDVIDAVGYHAPEEVTKELTLLCNEKPIFALVE